MDDAALLAGLDEQQRRAVTSTATPLAVLAPAGSGKTRVLTRRIAWRVAHGDADPRHVLAVTFTRKAARELAGRLRRLGLRDDVTSGTFHALALAQLRDHRRETGGRVPTVLDRKRPLLEEVVTDAGGPPLRGPGLAELAGEIEWAKARTVPPARYVEAAAAARRRTGTAADRVGDLYRRYEMLKRERGLFDFDDLLLETAQLLERDPAFAEVQRWRFRHLFVDEFQDVNPLQFRLLEGWRGDRYDLCVVGDPQQAIYGWNGADPSFLLEIGSHYPPVEVVRLDRNYRSSPQILRGAASVLRSAGLSSDAVEPTGADGELPALVGHADERAEALAIARDVRRRQGSGRPWSDQAVLVRTHAQTGPLREALAAAGIPHQVRGNDPVVDHPDVRRLLGLLADDGRPLAAALDDVDAVAVDDHEGREAVAALVEQAREYLRATPDARGSDFAAFARASVDRRDARSSRDAVVVATFHAAKGLEWPVVHLAGLEAGYVPIGHARSRADRAEEARLLYVAMTRAERELRLNWARVRTLRSGPAERQPSPLLAGLPTDEPAHPSIDEVHDRLASPRAALRSSTPPDDRALLALRDWRERAARRARLDPAAVVPDRVLRDLARRRPLDRAGLAEVPGLGPLKAERFADDLLAVLASFPAEP